MKKMKETFMSMIERFARVPSGGYLTIHKRRIKSNGLLTNSLWTNHSPREVPVEKFVRKESHD